MAGISDSTRRTGRSRYVTWVAALTWAASAQDDPQSPNDTECSGVSPSSVSEAVTTLNAYVWAGIRAAPSLISARTGVIPVVPMISAEVISAPSQCDTSMIFGPATPGKKYLLPPDMPTTSCGSTGPTTSAMSWSTTARLRCTSTSPEIRPSDSSSIRADGIVPRWANVSGFHHSWLRTSVPGYM